MKDRRLAVIGLGNPLRGDDGIGPWVVKELTRRGLPEGVTALDGGTSGLDLLHILEEWPRVILVDAADVGRKPGEFVRFTPDEVGWIGREEGYSLHNAGLAEVLSLAQALGRSLPPMVVFGVQPERIDWGDSLTSAVEASLPALVEAIIREVGEDDGQNLDN